MSLVILTKNEQELLAAIKAMTHAFKYQFGYIPTSTQEVLDKYDPPKPRCWSVEFFSVERPEVAQVILKGKPCFVNAQIEAVKEIL